MIDTQTMFLEDSLQYPTIISILTFLKWQIVCFTLQQLPTKDTNISDDNQVVPNNAWNQGGPTLLQEEAMRLLNDPSNVPILNTPMWQPNWLPHHLISPRPYNLASCLFTSEPKWLLLIGPAFFFFCLLEPAVQNLMLYVKKSRAT